MNSPELRKNLYVVAGATATGKSDFAIVLAKNLGASIINGDSRQVYKGMSIGAAQPIPDEVHSENKDYHWVINGIKHYLYGHREIEQDYSVAHYQKEVFELLEKNPSEKFIIVGGSGLFIDSVIYNYSFTDDSKIEVQFSREELDAMSISQLKEQISNENLDRLNESDKANPARLIRVIERGIPQKQNRDPFLRYFLLEFPREDLLKRINLRTKKMFENGIIDEVNALWEKYPGFEHKALKSIGYQEFIPYLNGDSDLESVKKQINIHTRQYAKRQQTWFKKNPDIKRISNTNDNVKSLTEL
jgi:tRNA dimethylallyltransferase